MAKTFYELENEVKELEVKVEKLICELTKNKRKLGDVIDAFEYYIDEINSIRDVFVKLEEKQNNGR
jgi:septation ring formation regulator EzrA